MLHIILQILSIIGIILLCLIGFIITLLLLALFVPVRYRLKGETDTKHFEAEVHFTWLLQLIRVHYSYPEPNRLIARILFFKVFDSGKEESKKEDSKKEKPQENVQKDDSTAQNTKTEATVSKPLAPPVFESKEEKKERTSKFQKIRYTIKRFCDKIKTVFQNIKYYISLLQEDENKLLFSRCKNHLLKVLLTVLPKHLNVNLKFGTGQPDTTGYVLGAYYSMIYPRLGKNMYINVEPDFNNAVFECDFYAKGHMTVFTFLKIAFQLWRDPQLKILINKLKMED